jgi:hypothetical protein
MSLDFRTHRLWDSFSSVHMRVALIIGALLIAPVVTGAKPWERAGDCERAPVASPRAPARVDDGTLPTASPVSRPDAG